MPRKKNATPTIESEIAFIEPPAPDDVSILQQKEYLGVRMKIRIISIFCYLLLCTCLLNLATAADLNTIMMEATCKVVGKGSIGTGFVIGKLDPDNPPRAFYTLITADRVLRAVQGDTVVLVFRQKQEDGSWIRTEIAVMIRENDKPLWKKHPEVDVAAIFVRLPKSVITQLVTTDLLIDDKKLLEYEISPGTELLCLGYPFGAEANAEGFPILRSGRIASYPITPTKKYKTFLFDFTVFRGDSGGPVYFVLNDPNCGGTRGIGVTIYGILGIVVEEKNITENIQELYENKENVTPLRLGEVIHANFIKELIESMTAPKE
jgi:hypothetical protein